MKGITSIMLSTMVFLSVFGYLASAIAGVEFIFLTPISIGVIVTGIGVVIVAGNTPVARGAALAIVASGIFGQFFFDSQFTNLGLDPVLIGIVIIPIAIVFLMAFVESSRG